MKACRFCDTRVESSVQHCPNCGAAVFLHVCGNCGTLFESRYCPDCGVKAGQEKKTCPDCGSFYFTSACPDCGYIPSRKAAGRVKAYPSFRSLLTEAPAVPASEPGRAVPREKSGGGLQLLALIGVIVAALIWSRIA